MSKPSKQLKLVVKNGGEITTIYDDSLVSLFDQANRVDVRRASHVEPHTVEWGDGMSYWQADLSPAGGPMLTGFKTRKQALDAEVLWLNQHIIE